MTTAPRHKTTQPIAVCLDQAEEYLRRSRTTIDNGRPLHALFWLMHGGFQLLRAEAKLDAIPD